MNEKFQGSSRGLLYVCNVSFVNTNTNYSNAFSAVSKIDTKNTRFRIKMSFQIMELDCGKHLPSIL